MLNYTINFIAIVIYFVIYFFFGLCVQDIQSVATNFTFPLKREKPTRKMNWTR